jgi:choline dehydrogenase-like flavoprotein
MQLSIIDLSKDYNVVRFESTICVIGSGPGGAFAAVELASEGHDVLIVEAGASSVEMNPSDSIASMLVSGEANTRFGSSRQLGGSSNLWAGRVASFEGIDFEKRDWIPDSGWPINLQDLQPYYLRSAEIMGIPYPHFLDASKAPISKNFKKLFSNSSQKGLDLKRFFWVQPPFNTGDYIETARQTLKGRLRVLTNAHVRFLEQDSDTGNINNAVIAAPDGREYKVTAKSFVLAAGGIETPRILLNSTTKCTEGIGNQNDNVGRYFCSHPKADLGVLVLNNRIATSHPLFKDYSVNNLSVRYGIGLSASFQTESRGLNHYVQLSPMLEYRLSKVFEGVKDSKALKSPFIDRNRFVRGLLPGLGLLAYEAIGRLAGLQRKARLFMLRGFLDQYPDRENRISLSSQCDKYGDRKVNLSWKFSEQDKQSVLTFFAKLNDELTAQGIGHIETSLSEIDEWPLIGVHSHFMGTTRMGDAPEHAVVDKDCKVFGTENLFISGPSTFSTGGYANPFFTIAALSLRLADHLNKNLKHSN